MEYFIAFILALITFNINQRIQKFINIKILINSLFDIYGKEKSFHEHDMHDASIKLMDEIIEIEKKTDNDYYIDKQIVKLKKLRLLYFNKVSPELIEQELNKIKFEKLDKSFIILCFFNIKLTL